MRATWRDSLFLHVSLIHRLVPATPLTGLCGNKSSIIQSLLSSMDELSISM